MIYDRRIYKAKLQESLQGKSGAKLQRKGNRIHKVASNTLESALWYKKAKGMVNVPMVYEICGDTMILEYIQSTEEPDVDSILDIVLTKFYGTVIECPDFQSYVDRIDNHVFEQGIDRRYQKAFVDNTDLYHDSMFKTFCHGDLSIDNVISNKGVLYFIDPNYLPEVWSSWVLDISKLCMSLVRFKKDRVTNKETESKEMKAMELSHWIRFYKYTDDKKTCLEEMEKLYNVIND